MRGFRKTILIPVAFLLLVISLTVTGRESDLSIYRDKDFGYQMEYPTGWGVIEAKPRADNLATWAGYILEEGELRKVTFRERVDVIWPGEFQIVTLSNPRRLTFMEWVEKYDVMDIAGGSLIEKVEETTLGGEQAKRFAIFAFDHQGMEIAAMNQGLIYLLRFAGDNPNDPEMERHSEIYEHMVSSFRFTD